MRDDYSYWQSTNFQSVGGKPFPIDPRDTHTLSMFFDDNADDCDKPIICPLLPNQEMGDAQEFIKSEHIVAVRPKGAILDGNYFINKVKKCILTNRV